MTTAATVKKLSNTDKQRTEDLYGMLIAFTLFALTLTLAYNHQNLKRYEEESAWPLGKI